MPIPASRPLIELTGDPKTDEIAGIINNHPDPAGLCRNVLAQLDAQRQLDDLCAEHQLRIEKCTPEEMPGGPNVLGIRARFDGDDTTFVLLPARTLPSEQLTTVACLINHAGVTA